jgi:proliferating cell nuclear antigen
MFEAKLTEGVILKKIVDSIKDLVTDVNIDITPQGKLLLPFHIWTFPLNAILFYIGISLQAMDSSHVALVSLNLSQDGFEHYRADTNMVLGVSIANLAKVMKLADNNDTITLQAEQDASHLKITFENPKNDRTTTFNLNLITLDSEHLAIPEIEYSSIVSLNSGEFSKICRELYAMSETVSVTTNPEFVQFSVDGDIGQGSVKLGQNEGERKEDQTMLQVTENIE